MISSHEKRRKEPSYTIPFLYEGLELVLIWIVFSLIEGTMEVGAWGILSYIGAGVWFLYTFYKLRRVLDRQVLSRR